MIEGRFRHGFLACYWPQNNSQVSAKSKTGIPKIIIPAIILDRHFRIIYLELPMVIYPCRSENLFRYGYHR